jgi:hypothetical protein
LFANVLYIVEPCQHLLQAKLDGKQARMDVVVGSRDWLADGRKWSTVEDGDQMLRVPFKRKGQGLEGSSTATSFGDVPPYLSHHGVRDSRASDQVNLGELKIGHAIVDRLRDCRPIFRHAQSSAFPVFWCGPDSSADGAPPVATSAD